MTKEQLQTRIKWFIKELKAVNVLPDAANFDPKLIAIRQTKDVNLKEFFFNSNSKYLKI
jgi:ABC-type antimicrobial peptide transport system ATPase subunit